MRTTTSLTGTVTTGRQPVVRYTEADMHACLFTVTATSTGQVADSQDTTTWCECAHGAVRLSGPGAQPEGYLWTDGQTPMRRCQRASCVATQKAWFTWFNAETQWQGTRKHRETEAEIDKKKAIWLALMGPPAPARANRMAGHGGTLWSHGLYQQDPADHEGRSAWSGRRNTATCVRCRRQPCRCQTPTRTKEMMKTPQTPDEPRKAVTFDGFPEVRVFAGGK
jgi:hypothetical protein